MDLLRLAPPPPASPHGAGRSDLRENQNKRFDDALTSDIQVGECRELRSRPKDRCVPTMTPLLIECPLPLPITDSSPSRSIGTLS